MHVQTKCKMDHDLYFTRAEAARVSNEETTDTIIIPGTGRCQRVKGTLSPPAQIINGGC